MAKVFNKLFLLKISILPKSALYLLLYVAAFHNIAGAQPGSLANLPEKDRLARLNGFYSSTVINGDSLTVLHYINSVQDVAKTAHDKDLLTEASLMKAYFYFIRARKQPPAYTEAFFADIKDNLSKYPNDYALARYEDMVATWNWEVKHNNELAFEHWDKALDIYRKLPDRILEVRSCLQKIYDCRYEFGDYREAISALKESLALSSQPNSYLLIHSNNTLGLCYQQLNQLDSADYYFKITYNAASTDKNADWQAIASGNMGNILFLRGQYDDAIPLLQFDVDMSVKRQDWPCASGSQTILADIMLRKNNLLAAAAALNKAKQYVYASAQYKRLKPLYPLLAKYYAASGNAKMATLYLDSAAFVSDSLARAFNAIQILKATQKADLEKRNAAVAEIESQKQVKILERNVLVVFVAFLLAASLYVYRSQRKKHLHKQQLLNLQLKEKEAELNLASSRLENFARNISEKNRMLETLQQQFGDNINNEALLLLQKSTILTDEEWEQFRETFEKVHGGYLNRLKQKLPGLSPAETRYMALAKLKLSNKEMAATLGITVQAIRVTTFRLRKKLQMPEDGSLDELVSSI